MSMTTSIKDAYRMYLEWSMTIGELREWLAVHQWHLVEAEEERLVDEADVALAHFDDGYGDEADLRLRLQGALIP